jgi:hypothetical protein
MEDDIPMQKRIALHFLTFDEPNGDLKLLAEDVVNKFFDKIAKEKTAPANNDTKHESKNRNDKKSVLGGYHERMEKNSKSYSSEKAELMRKSPEKKTGIYMPKPHNNVSNAEPRTSATPQLNRSIQSTRPKTIIVDNILMREQDKRPTLKEQSDRFDLKTIGSVQKIQDSVSQIDAPQDSNKKDLVYVQPKSSLAVSLPTNVFSQQKTQETEILELSRLLEMGNTSLDALSFADKCLGSTCNADNSLELLNSVINSDPIENNSTQEKTDTELPAFDDMSYNDNFFCSWLV